MRHVKVNILNIIQWQEFNDFCSKKLKAWCISVVQSFLDYTSLKLSSFLFSLDNKVIWIRHLKYKYARTNIGYPKNKA